MSTWRMSLGPTAITIRTDLDLTAIVDVNRARPRANLYQLEGVEAAPDQEPTLTVEVVNDSRAALTVDPSTGDVLLRAPHAELSVEDLLYLAYVVLESRLHQYGIITLHAAAVERDGRALVLLGHAGAGKTTTALRLCRDHGFSLLGNDLVVVGGADALRVHAGTCNLRLRHSSIAGSMPELLHLFIGVCEDPWRTKIDIWPEQLGIPLGLERAEVGLVAFVHTDPAYAGLIDTDGDTLVHRLNLYENALRYVRATSTPWLIGEQRGFGPYVPSFDNPPAHHGRTVTLQRLLVMSRYVAGPPEAVAASIAQTLRSPVAATPGGTL